MSEKAQTLLARAEELLLARRLAEASAAYTRAADAGAPAGAVSAGRWQIAMLEGRFEDAWRENDESRRCGHPDPDRFWMREPIAGQRVMLRCLHGFGDAIQYLSYAPRLRELASKLIVEVPPRFVELAKRFAGVDEVITWGDEAPAITPTWDVQVEIMELPYLFRTQVSELPIASNYIAVPPLQETKTGGGFEVGLAWACGAWNLERAIEFRLLEPMLETKQCLFWSLQSEQDALPTEQARRCGIQEDLRAQRSVLALAQRVRALNLVITADTMAAHLAGAMGVPAWLLLTYAADWRWLDRRTDSPWYSGMRIFRQPAPGDWTAVIDEVRRALTLEVQQGA